jgi:hypothetical protein
MLVSAQIAAMMQPLEGSKSMEVILDFTTTPTFTDDLGEEMSKAQLSFVQSVWIDNSQNAAQFTINFAGTNLGQTVTVDPYHRGMYPVTAPAGVLRYRAGGGQGTRVPIIFYNCAMPYFDWGPTPGVLITPNLLPKVINLKPAVAGNNVLIPGAVGKVTAVYRGIVSIDNPSLLQFTDGAGGALLFPVQLTAGGSLTWQASGVPWIIGSVGSDIVLNSSAAVNIYGPLGYTQL